MIRKFLFFPLIIITILLAFILCNGYVQKNDTDKEYAQIIDKEYNVFSVVMPDSVDFCGERFPLERMDVYERLDKELTINTHWHSSSILAIKRANRFFSIIEPILKKHNIPDDIKYIALIESGLENVRSPAGASGFWQIMKNTAIELGLEVNKNVDERYNLELATVAACKYFIKAYKKTDSWILAAASYNAGIPRIKENVKAQKTSSFFDLNLNKETSRYVYRAVAFKTIMQNLQQYGFNIRKKDLYLPYKYDTLVIDSAISTFVDFADSLNITYRHIRQHNPWLRQRFLLNKSRKKYNILIPKEESLFRTNDYVDSGDTNLFLKYL